MKNFLYKIVAAVAVLCLLSAPAFGQSSVCQFSTCVPGIPFTNTDNMQVYGAILAGNRGTGTVVVSSGTIVVSSGTITGNFGGYNAKVSTTVSVDGVYSIGDNVGTVQTVSNCFRVGQTTGVLNDLELWDDQLQKAGLVIDLWTTTPTGTFVNNGVQVINTSNMGFYLGSVVVNPSDYILYGNIYRVSISGIGIILKSGLVAGTERNVYFTVSTSGTPNYGSNQKIYVRFGVTQD